MRWPRPSAPVLVGWSAAATCLIGALALGPISRATSPWFAVRVGGEFGAYRDVHRWAEGDLGSAEPPPDPWGRPWSVVELSTIDGPHFLSTEVYSTGPNGVDESGEGDDVWLDPAQGTPAATSIIPLRALKSPRFVLLVAAMLLAVYTFAAWMIPPVRRGTLPDEIKVAGGIALPWALPALVWAGALQSESAGQTTIDALQQRGLVVPFPLAAVGSVLLAAFALALAWRLTRPPR